MDLGIKDLFVYILLAAFVLIFTALMFKKAKKDSAENQANFRQYLLLEPKDAIESSVAAMRNDLKPDHFVTKLKKSASELDADNFLDIMRLIKEDSGEASYLVYCKG
jgi:hypothetical protein